MSRMSATSMTPCLYCGRPRGPKRLKTCLSEECQYLKRRDASRAHENRQRAALLAAGVEMFRCAICGEPQQTIGRHLAVHDLSSAEYKARYPDAPLATAAVRAFRSKGSSSQAQARRDAYQGRLPDQYLAEFLTGALLGDGSLECRKKNARYAEGGKNEMYLRWKHSVLQRYFPATFKERLSAPHVRSGKCYRGWWVRTVSHPLLTEAYKDWYSGGVKGVPAGVVEQHLTEFALAVWFCDDGNASKDRGQANLYTMGFQLGDVKFLQELLLLRFGLASNILFNKKRQPFLQFGHAARIGLQEILRRNPLPGMDYKAISSQAAVVVEADGQHPAVVENAGGGVYVVIGVFMGDRSIGMPKQRMVIRRRSRHAWILEVDGQAQTVVWPSLHAARCAATVVETSTKKEVRP